MDMLFYPIGSNLNIFMFVYVIIDISYSWNSYVFTHRHSFRVERLFHASIYNTGLLFYIYLGKYKIRTLVYRKPLCSMQTYSSLILLIQGAAKKKNQNKNTFHYTVLVTSQFGLQCYKQIVFLAFIRNVVHISYLSIILHNAMLKFCFQYFTY